MPTPFDPKRIRTVIFDADGVLIHGRTPHPGAIELLDWVRQSGRKLYVLTNNSSTARVKYAARMRRLGFHLDRSEIITSGYLTARYFVECQRTRPFPQFAVRKPHIFVVGGEGIGAEFQAVGVGATLTRSVQDPRKPHFVIAGIDRTLTYAKIARAQRAIMVEGALFIATNQDPTFPVEDGFQPGAGTVVAAIATAVGRPPDIVVGKPHPLAMRIALHTAGCKPSEVLIVGDRLDTDIETGRRARVFSVLVL
ncbi:MAG: HAD-IIA family hydrolase, partial [Planctomycetes bacterium]|nr:HAD-IIA family hydrolase [Planctomycetota bacterium]